MEIFGSDEVLNFGMRIGSCEIVRFERGKGISSGNFGVSSAAIFLVGELQRKGSIRVLFFLLVRNRRYDFGIFSGLPHAGLAEAPSTFGGADFSRDDFFPLSEATQEVACYRNRSLL